MALRKNHNPFIRSFGISSSNSMKRLFTIGNNIKGNVFNVIIFKSVISKFCDRLSIGFNKASKLSQNLAIITQMITAFIFLPGIEFNWKRQLTQVAIF